MTTRAMVIVGAFLCMILAACNTVHGMGQDMQSAGHAIERAAGK